jgi:hypothetical protein
MDGTKLFLGKCLGLSRCVSQYDDAILRIGLQIKYA